MLFECYLFSSTYFYSICIFYFNASFGFVLLVPKFLNHCIFIGVVNSFPLNAVIGKLEFVSVICYFLFICLFLFFHDFLILSNFLVYNFNFFIVSFMD